MMIKLKFSFSFLLMPLCLWSQDEKRKELVSPYLLADFSSGILYFAGRTTQTVSLNYHKVSEQLVMAHLNSKLPIEDITTLDSATIGAHTFVKSDGRLLEQLIASPNQLLVRHRATVQLEAKEGAFGTKSQSTNVDRVVLGQEVAGNYDLRWSDEYRFVAHTEVWFVRDGVLHKANNAGQVGSIFPEIRKEIKNFVAAQNIDFDNSRDIRKVFLFCLDQERD